MAAAALLTAFCAAVGAADDSGPSYVGDLGWAGGQVARTLALRRGWGMQAPAPAQRVDVEGRDCVVAGVLAIDVDDGYAFDVDETFELELELSAPGEIELLLAYDRNGRAPSLSRHYAVRDPESGLARIAVRLRRARFAGRGDFATDLAIAAFYRDPALPRAVRARRGPGRDQRPAALCALRLARTAEPAPRPVGFGGIELTFVDPDSGRPTAARVGIYDESGRMPLASGAAVALHLFGRRVRQLVIPAGEYWPLANRWAFYADGVYRARLPPGRYSYAATKGPEYRGLRGRFRVVAGRTRRLERTFERFARMAERGWYSGDPHLHIRRLDAGDEQSALALIAAEDLWMGGTLEMGNLAATHFPQRWGEKVRTGRHGRRLASGQEDPRTARRGHALALNLARRVRSPRRYYLAHETAARVRRQGGLWGYAHLQRGWFRAAHGLALDLPFGLVDFVEVLQDREMGLAAWYRALDLGFRVAPTAGSDYPYLGLPGAVRNYVEVEGRLTTGSWHRGLRAGRTFVTNGPLLTLEVAGHGMGEELRVAAGTRLRVRASARLNPDLGRLRALELVAHGVVVHREPARLGAGTLELDHTLVADESLWLAVRTVGGRYGLAHSGPVYVRVDGRPFWKRSALPRLVAEQLELLARLDEPVDPRQLSEPWESEALTAVEWERQREELLRRAEQAAARYRRMLRRLDADSPR